MRDEARRLTDYGWKLPFCEALGWNAVLHEGWRDPGIGVLVPDYPAHRRHAASG